MSQPTFKVGDIVDWNFDWSPTNAGTTAREYGPGPFFVSRIVDSPWYCQCGGLHTKRKECTDILEPRHPQTLLLSVYWKCGCHGRNHKKFTDCDNTLRSVKNQAGWNRYDFDGLLALHFKKV